jgi:hypothetical protein
VLVPSVNEILHSTAHKDKSEQIFADFETQTQRNTPSLKEIDTSGMPCIRESLEEQNLSLRTIQIIMNSWRKSTQNQYSAYIFKWIEYARENSYIVIHAKLTEALDFLTFCLILD